MTAPDLSPAEAAIVARFDAAPTPPEVLREQVQTVAADAVRNIPADWWCPERSNTTRLSCEYCIAEVAVDAALAVFRGQRDPAIAEDLRRVTVCASCLTAACWNGQFMCGDSVGAGTVDLPIAALRELGREHSGNWATR